MKKSTKNFLRVVGIITAGTFIARLIVHQLKKHDRCTAICCKCGHEFKAPCTCPKCGHALECMCAKCKRQDGNNNS